MVLQMAGGGVRTADAGAHLGKGGGTWHLSKQQTTTPKIWVFPAYKLYLHYDIIHHFYRPKKKKSHDMWIDAEIAFD